MEQLSLAESHPAGNANSAQPRRRRSSLLRRLSLTFQRDTSTTRYDNFEGHRDSLEIIRHQIQANGIAYRPGIPHPRLDNVDLEDGSDNCNTNESGTNNGTPAEDVQVPVDTIQTPTGESSEEKQGEGTAECHHAVNNSDVASQEDANPVLSAHERSQVNRGQPKINANNSTTPLPTQFQNDKVGFARSA